MRKQLLSDADVNALHRAIEQCRSESSEEERELLDRQLARDWTEAALQCVYRCQIANLHLRPWQSPPVAAVDNPEALRLRSKLIEAGLSEYEPNPATALQAQQSARGESARAGSPE
jgi:hypothetical protein